MGFDSLPIISKNARINSNERIISLLAELSFQRWSFVCFSETRTEKMDCILTGGHRLICEYGGGVASGVAVLVHRQWVRFIRKKILVNDRLMAIDLKIGEKLERVVSVYI